MSYFYFFNHETKRIKKLCKLPVTQVGRDADTITNDARGGEEGQVEIARDQLQEKSPGGRR